jgi:tetratricopeptide (TPR) repeat protein
MTVLQGLNQDKIWLVKSAGVILGPYTLDELTEALQQRHVTIIDEVKDACGRWSFVREHPRFAQIVQFLRDQQISAKDDTGTMSLTNKTQTNTDPTIVDEVTPPPSPSAVPSNPEPARSAKEAATTTYVFKNDEKVRQRIQRTRQSYALWAWGLCLLIVVGASGAFFAMRRPTPASLGFDDCVRLATYNQELGIYDRALEYYKKAEAIRSLPSTLRMKMAFLLMVVEDQNMAARQILESLQRQTSSDELERLIALSFLREGRLPEAQKRYTVLVRKNSTDEVAQENLLMVEILQAQFQTAYNKLSVMMRNGIKDPLLIVYKSMVAYRLFSPEKDRQKLLDAVDDLKRYARDFEDYKLEILMLIAAIQDKLGNEKAVVENLHAMMTEFPDLTRDHIHNEMINREILSWSYLSNICDLLTQKNGASAIAMGLKAYCAYQRQDMKTALDLVEKARNQFSSDNYLVGLHAFLLMKSGRDEEAKALFQLPEAKENPLIWAVHGQVCELQKDWACADESWHGLLNRDAKNLEALRGMAVLSLNRGQREMAGDLIKRGLLISDNFRPLVALKEQVDAH